MKYLIIKIKICGNFQNNLWFEFGICTMRYSKLIARFDLNEHVTAVLNLASIFNFYK